MHLAKLETLKTRIFETFEFSKHSKQVLIFNFIELKSFGRVKRFIDDTFERSTWITLISRRITNCACARMRTSSFVMGYGEYCETWIPILAMPNGARQCCR